MAVIKNHDKIRLSYDVQLTIKNNMYKLTHENGLVRDRARKILESIGTPAVDFLVEFICHPDTKARWEAVKALSEINDPIAAPFLVNALEDESSDIRLLAAEGLYTMGEKGLLVLFQTLFIEPDSVLIRKGAHHILTNMAENSDEPEIKKLIDILNSTDPEIKIPAEGKLYLKKILEISNTNNS